MIYSEFPLVEIFGADRRRYGCTDERTGGCTPRGPRRPKRCSKPVKNQWQWCKQGIETTLLEVVWSNKVLFLNTVYLSYKTYIRLSFFYSSENEIYTSDFKQRHFVIWKRSNYVSRNVTSDIPSCTPSSEHEIFILSLAKSSSPRSQNTGVVNITHLNV